MEKSQLSPSNRYKTLIFDLGNVILSFSHEKMYAQIARLCDLSVEAIKEFFLDGRIGIQYERGLISSDEIFSLLCEKSGKALDYAEVMIAGSDIFIPRPEMLDLLKILKKQGYHLMLLSNINEAHYRFINKQYDLFNLFNHLILSFEAKAVKPEKEIFKQALKHAPCPPQACYYIDDIPENVQAAEKLGVKGHIFTSPALLFKDLQAQKILP